MKEELNREKLIELGKNLPNEVHEIMQLIDESEWMHWVTIVSTEEGYKLKLLDYNGDNSKENTFEIHTNPDCNNEDVWNILYDELYVEMAWNIFELL